MDTDFSKAIESDFSLLRKSTWRDTLCLGELPFVNYSVFLKEMTEDTLSKNEKDHQKTKIEGAEKQHSSIFKVGYFVYCISDHLLYKVIEIEKDQEGNPTSILILSQDDSLKKEISDTQEFANFKDSITLILSIFDPTQSESSIEVELKLYERLETSLQRAFSGFDKNIFNYILFYKGKILNRKDCPYGIQDLKDDDTIFASYSYQKLYRFSRFKKVVQNDSWWNNSDCPESLIIVPQRSIVLAGFSCFAAQNQDHYYLRYEVHVDGRVTEKDQLIASDWIHEGGNKIYKLMLKNPIEVEQWSKIKLFVWIGKDFQTSGNIETDFGSEGDEYNDIPNENQGIFEIESNTEVEESWTDLYSGHFGDIFYHLL
ncbi:unnamed protein product [Moneuplotes crassus]|uniref:PHR domain-containing protein n=1 Tax=Euplotes crassus TaxID=5936 RepID=A0AAD1XCW7_EUPCR|nr:unnamed protein product [Moneuplotes crassus]